MLASLCLKSYVYLLQPDPLIEALESVVGEHSLEGNLQAALADTEVSFPDSLFQLGHDIFQNKK